MFFMLLLVSMTATAAACSADEHNLLKAGGFLFPLTFFHTSCWVFFVYNECLNGGSLSYVVWWGHKIPSTHTSQVHAGPRSPEVLVSLAAATWSWLNLLVMMRNTNCYAAHAVKPHCSFTSCCFKGVCQEFICETGSSNKPVCVRQKQSWVCQCPVFN